MQSRLAGEADVAAQDLPAETAATSLRYFARKRPLSASIPAAGGEVREISIVGKELLKIRLQLEGT